MTTAEYTEVRCTCCPLGEEGRSTRSTSVLVQDPHTGRRARLAELGCHHLNRLHRLVPIHQLCGELGRLRLEEVKPQRVGEKGVRKLLQQLPPPRDADLLLDQ